MLRQRIITAVVLAALILGSILSGNQILFLLLLAAFVFLAAWEWAGLAGCRMAQQKIIYAVLLALPLPFFIHFINAPWVAPLILIGAVAWCVAAIMIFSYQAGGHFMLAGRFAGYVTGFFVLAPAWMGLLWLSPPRVGPEWVLLFFATVCLADIAAYFGGRRWGKNRLATRVSPGKTREGFYAGVTAASLPAIAFVLYKGYPASSGMWLIVLCVICAVFSVAGDLFVSMFKRHAHIKDSGHILPGHGGVLDRIDSSLAAAPVFATGVWLLEGRL